MRPAGAERCERQKRRPRRTASETLAKRNERPTIIVMEEVARPSLRTDHPDSQLSCEQALDDPVRDLIDAAIVSGWPPETVFAALKSVVANRQLAYAEDPDPAPDPPP
jgi:hypothetical protein